MKEENLKVVCDECGKEFRVITKNLYTRPIERDIRETYLRCPKCGKEYHVTYTSKQSRTLTRAWEREGNPINSKIHKELKEETRKINEYMNLMKSLRGGK